MTDQQIPAHALLGVYPPDQVPDLVRRLTAAGVRDQDVHTGEGDDVTTSLRAEMREEASESVIMPQVGVLYSKEATKATNVLLPVLAVVGAVLALPLALALPGDMALWTRLLLCAVCGALVGGTVGVIVPPAMAVKNQDEPNAAQRGVVVRVARWTPEVEHLMADAHPLRLDRLGPDQEPIGPVVTEEAATEGGIVEEVGRNFAREAAVEPEHRSR